MDEKIYKLSLIRRKTRSYYDLSAEERAQLHKQIDQIQADVGARLASPVYNAMWSNEQVSEFKIVEYPNANAVFEEMDCLEKILFPKYFQASYLLGKPQPWADLPFTPRQPVAKLVMLRDDEDSYHRLPEAAKTQVWDDIFKAVTQVGARTEANWYNCLAASGTYSGFGIMEYPDLQALVDEVTQTEGNGLLSYFHSEVILGVKAQPEVAAG
jgi:diadenosine tetraphosphate (Ap4A) HIT family hydrolase